LEEVRLATTANKKATRFIIYPLYVGAAEVPANSEKYLRVIVFLAPTC
jgi:hypothetical protein